MENTILSQILDELKELKQGQQQTTQRLDKMDARLDKMDSRLDNLKNNVSLIKADVVEIKADVVEIKNQLNALEAKNANNHLEIRSILDTVSRNISVLEAVSGKNMTDIALLKVVK